MPINYKSQAAQYRKYYEAVAGITNKPKNRAYTTAVFSFLAVSLFGWYAIRPTLQTILFLRREITDKTEINKKMEEKISNLIQAQATYQTIQDNITLLDEALPQNPEAISLVEQMKNLAENTGAVITSLQVAAVPVLVEEAPQQTNPTPAAPTTKSITSFKTKTFAFSIILVGDYPALKMYLDGIMSMRRVVSIDSLNFLPTEDQSLRLVLKLHSYYLSR